MCAGRDGRLIGLPGFRGEAERGLWTSGPRLVVTGEVTGGRDVNDVVELDVLRVEPTG
ncbi:hypothetical protein [Streptomyces sp. NPDC059455]|uniref:hypothetical protein n=1 Tax=Streptomyces sp. NPDC059455 TaxID=3346837 RepID=UPI003676270E